MSKAAQLEAVAKSQDLSEFLDHIGWTLVLRPQLQRERENLTKLLVSAVLGNAASVRDSEGNTSLMNKEQLAGKIYGINWLQQYIESTLSSGDRARKSFESEGITFDFNNSN